MPNYKVVRYWKFWSPYTERRILLSRGNWKLKSKDTGKHWLLYNSTVPTEILMVKFEITWKNHDRPNRIRQAISKAESWILASEDWSLTS